MRGSEGGLGGSSYKKIKRGKLGTCKWGGGPGNKIDWNSWQSLGLEY
jgi:hypothetical protein